MVGLFLSFFESRFSVQHGTPYIGVSCPATYKLISHYQTGLPSTLYYFFVYDSITFISLSLDSIIVILVPDHKNKVEVLKYFSFFLPT
jgi:hypothetical protein